MPGRWRFLVLAAGAALALVLFLVLRADDEAPNTSPAPPPATATATQPAPPATGTTPQPAPPATGTAPQPSPPPPPPPPRLIYLRTNTDGVARTSIRRGSRVTLVVTGAPGEEIHLHGYDVKREIGPDGTVVLPFRATIPGRFEVELEASHRQIAGLTVR